MAGAAASGWALPRSQPQRAAWRAGSGAAGALPAVRSPAASGNDAIRRLSQRQRLATGPPYALQRLGRGRCRAHERRLVRASVAPELVVCTPDHGSEDQMGSAGQTGAEPPPQAVPGRARAVARPRLPNSHRLILTCPKAGAQALCRSEHPPAPALPTSGRIFLEPRSGISRPAAVRSTASSE